MARKNWFVIAILILYLCFLGSDRILGFFDNTSQLSQMMDNEKLEYYKNEYEKMSNILEVEADDYEVIYSKVVLREIYQFYDEITIGKGTSDGIQKGDLVVNENGVVGVIKDARNTSSVVRLLTSPDMELSVKINGSYGILTSVDKTLIVKNIKLDSEIKEGDLVYTSGLTSIPGDILVGEVSKVNRDSLELEYILDVDSITHQRDISYVAVLHREKSEVS